MGKHKLKHSNDKRGDAALAHSSRKRMLNLDLDNLNHSATVAVASGENKQGDAGDKPVRKSSRVIKRKFVLDKGTIKYLSDSKEAPAKEFKYFGDARRGQKGQTDKEAL